jgi:hypothetical protein
MVLAIASLALCNLSVTTTVNPNLNSWFAAQQMGSQQAPDGQPLSATELVGTSGITDEGNIVNSPENVGYYCPEIAPGLVLTPEGELLPGSYGPARVPLQIADPDVINPELLYANNSTSPTIQGSVPGQHPNTGAYRRSGIVGNTRGYAVECSGKFPDTSDTHSLSNLAGSRLKDTGYVYVSPWKENSSGSWNTGGDFGFQISRAGGNPKGYILAPSAIAMGGFQRHHTARRSPNPSLHCSDANRLPICYLLRYTKGRYGGQHHLG